MAPPRDKPGSAPIDADAEKRSGRVAFDDRGNSVWEWQVETGVYSRDVNTQSVPKLDLDELSLEETSQVRALELVPAQESRLDRAKPGGGFNPYDNTPVAKHAGHDPYRTPRQEEVSSPAAKEPVRRTSADLRKLSEWILMKRGLKNSEG